MEPRAQGEADEAAVAQQAQCGNAAFPVRKGRP